MALLNIWGVTFGEKLPVKKPGITDDILTLATETLPAICIFIRCVRIARRLSRLNNRLFLLPLSSCRVFNNNIFFLFSFSYLEIDGFLCLGKVVTLFFFLLILTLFLFVVLSYCISVAYSKGTHSMYVCIYKVSLFRTVIIIIRNHSGVSYFLFSLFIIYITNGKNFFLAPTPSYRAFFQQLFSFYIYNIYKYNTH